ncbi:MAG: hypothetical protein HC934_02890 [Acaryochloridaceae cyanobacterium SU_2_1]|nr:hypothetical protein [Acaryochloridaceae cyanobacterium SU_2_1]
MAAKKQDQLDILFPAEPFECGAGVLLVNPFKFGQFKRVLQVLKRYLAELEDSENPRSFVQVMLDVGEEALDDLAELTEMSTGCDRNFLEELPGHEAMNLFFKVAEVNADFFVQTIQEGSSRFSSRIEAKSKATDS